MDDRAMDSSGLDGPAWQTPEQVEQAFYEAFEQGDAAAMTQVWEASAVVCCIHPMGKALCGPEAVGQGWREIFASGVRLKFRREALSWMVAGDLAISVLHERITVAGEQKERPPMIATNVYHRSSAGWRMTLHHASPAVVEVASGQAGQRLLH